MDASMYVEVSFSLTSSAAVLEWDYLFLWSNAMDYKQKAIDHFSRDRFSIETTGVKIEKVEENYCLCSLAIEDKHLNANDFVMGGAIFTLADYAFGVAANSPEENCVTLSSTMNFMRPTKGPVLYAEAKCVKNGRTIAFFDVTVTEPDGKVIASAQISGFRAAK